ncbi:MAG: T9SS type A sorting domain-containing protein [bacterium]|nr:T9SS type A sorting domain-containing protein [bacterium]
MRILRLCFIVILLITFQNVDSVKAQTDYFADNGSFSAFTHIIQPVARYYKGKTYIVYQGTNFNSYITYYDHNSKEWSDIYYLGDSPIVKDGHASPSFLFDDQEFLHVFFGGHHLSPHTHLKSAKPGIISEWFNMPPFSDKSSYPTPMQLSDGTIYLFFREGGHCDNWVYKSSSDYGFSWNEPVSVLKGDYPDQGWYPTFLKGSNDNTIHCTFVWLIEQGPKRGGRYNVYYIFRDTDGIWKNISGEHMNLPLSKADADNSAKIYESGEKMTQVPWLCLDDNNNPYMMFTTGDFFGNTYFEYKFMKWTGSSWAVSDIGQTTDYFFDFYSLDLISPDILDAYITTGLTPEVGTFFDRGGNIEKWSSQDGGSNWQKTETIIANGNVHNDPLTVVDYHPEARIVLAEQPHIPDYYDQFDDFYNKLYLYGESGFVKRNKLASIIISDVKSPQDYNLEQNYPNPFNQTTTIFFRNTSQGSLSLKIYNIKGQLIKVLANGDYPRGDFSFRWNGINDQGIPAGSGIYIYRLQMGRNSYSKKMVLLK